MEQKLVILVTGESGAGKDYCANVWESGLATSRYKSPTTRTISISDAIKLEYAATTGADPKRLLWDRAYKEQHRPALSAYFQRRVRQHSRLPEENFVKAVCEATDVDVLLITGMRDKAPVAAFSHLVPDCRLVEVNVRANRELQRARRGCQNANDGDESVDGGKGNNHDHHHCLVFNNNTAGDEAATRFSERYLLPFLNEDLQRLRNMVRSVLDFPCRGIEFRHVLDIAQQPDGLALCTTLMRAHFCGDWSKIDSVACCEIGGLVFASVLAAQVNVPMALIREAGKLPPPTVSVIKTSSYISSSTYCNSTEKRIEMGRDAIPKGASVVVVDDVLATGKTLCAVLQLLAEVGIGAEDVNIMVVVEFPVHRGRELLRLRGFGRANVQSLLVFGGT